MVTIEKEGETLSFLLKQIIKAKIKVEILFLIGDKY